MDPLVSRLQLLLLRLLVEKLKSFLPAHLMKIEEV